MKSVDTIKRMLVEVIILFVFLILHSFYGCKKNNPVSPDLDTLSERLETENFIFHYATGDYVESDRQEAFHKWTIEQLGVGCPKKIDYYKYMNRSHIEQITGIWGDGWADSNNFAVHVVVSYDNHECVHLYTYLIGRPVQFFNEGIAVAFQTDPFNNDFVAKWREEPVHSYAKKFMNKGELIPLNDILETNDFEKYTSEITYPESGSFVRFMIDTHGLEKMKSLFKTGNWKDLKAIVKKNFQSIYGFSIEQAENDWINFLIRY